MESKSRIIFCVLVFLAFTTSAAALGIREISVSDDPVDYLKKFEVEVEFTGDTCNTVAWFFIDDYRFEAKNLACDAKDIIAEFDLDDDD